MLLRECGIHGVEFFDVVGAVAGGKGDAGEDYLGAALLQLVEDGGEVGLGLFDGQAAEAVVAAELYDNDLGMAGDDELDALEAIFGGVAADAGVDDVVVVAVGVEEALEVVGVGLAEIGAQAGGERVAEADDERTGVDGRGRGLRWCRRGNRGGRFHVTVCRLAAAEEEAGGEGGQSDKSNSG